MRSSQKRKIRRESEAQLYEPAKQAIAHLFREKSCYLEISATDRQMGENVKRVLADYDLFASVVERFIPDITGYILEANQSKSLIVVEVKPSPPRMKDIFQTKEYAEIFGAKYAFLISPHMVQEEVRRILKMKGELLTHTGGHGRVLIGWLREAEKEEMVKGKKAGWIIDGWFPDKPMI
jgi:hypothetical protein